MRPLARVRGTAVLVVATSGVAAVAGCGRERAIQSYCQSVLVGERLEVVRARAVKEGFDVLDFPERQGFLASRRTAPFGAAMCQVDATNGFAYKAVFFMD